MSDKSNEQKNANLKISTTTATTTTTIENVDLSTVQWDPEPVRQEVKSRTMNSQQRVAYRVAGIGTVAEEWRIMFSSPSSADFEQQHQQPQQSQTQKQQQQDIALYSVFVNDRLVRQIDLKTNRVIESDAQYEPFAFLRYGTNGNPAIENDEKQPTEAAVPIRAIENGKQ